MFKNGDSTGYCDGNNKVINIGDILIGKYSIPDFENTTFEVKYGEFIPIYDMAEDSKIVGLYLQRKWILPISSKIEYHDLAFRPDSLKNLKVQENV